MINKFSTKIYIMINTLLLAVAFFVAGVLAVSNSTINFTADLSYEVPLPVVTIVNLANASGEEETTTYDVAEGSCIYDGTTFTCGDYSDNNTCGFYTDEALTTPFEQTTEITEDITLYTKTATASGLSYTLSDSYYSVSASSTSLSGDVVIAKRYENATAKSNVFIII